MLHTCIHWVRNIISKFLKSNINKKSERKPEEKIRGIIIYRTIRIKFLIRNQTSNKRVVQFSSVAQPCPTFATLWIVAHQASLSVTNSWSPPKPMSIKLVMPSNHFILCCSLLFCPQSFPASGSFQMSQPFASGGQSIGASASVLPRILRIDFL